MTTFQKILFWAGICLLSIAEAGILGKLAPLWWGVVIGVIISIPQGIGAAVFWEKWNA